MPVRLFTNYPQATYKCLDNIYSNRNFLQGNRLAKQIIHFIPCHSSQIHKSTELSRDKNWMKYQIHSHQEMRIVWTLSIYNYMMKSTTGVEIEMCHYKEERNHIRVM